MAHWLFLPNDAIDDLEVLAKLSGEEVARLREFLDSAEFRPRYNFYVKVAELLGISDESAAKLCSFVNYVQTQRTRNKQTGAAVPDEFERFLQNSLEDKDRGSRSERLLRFIRDNRDALTRLFSALPEFDFSTKVRGLEIGPLPHLQNFRAFCDLRPVFDTGADEIVSCFPVITLCLVTHSAESDETKDVLVQL